MTPEQAIGQLRDEANRLDHEARPTTARWLRDVADLIEQQDRHTSIAADALKTKEKLNEALRNQVDSLKAQLAKARGGKG